MVSEVLEHLQPSRGGVFVDGTVGLGGHARAVLEAGASRLLGVDRDPAAVELAREHLREFGDRARVVHGDYRQLPAILDREGLSAVDGILLDLGVSSMQLDEPGRGFSFRRDEPLDMRMDTSAGPTAAEALADADEKTLADVIYELGEDRHARRIARAIVAARAVAPIETTGRLADVVRRAVPKRGYTRIDPATRTFQAMRIWVNRELEGLGDCPARGGGPAAPRREARRHRVPLARRPHRQARPALDAGERRERAARADQAAAGAGGGRDRSQPPGAQRQAARGGGVGFERGWRGPADEGVRMNAETFEYAIKKDVRNNPIVREIDRERNREMVRAVAIGVFLVSVLLFWAWQQFELRRNGYRLEQMQQERAVEAEVNRHLRLEAQTLQAPERIERIALGRLRMVAPRPEDASVIERVVETPPPPRSVVASR